VGSKPLRKMAGATGLEPAASGVTGRRSNQLSYAPKGSAGLKGRSRSSQEAGSQSASEAAKPSVRRGRTLLRHG
jgi:hypothetical protein